MVRGRLRPATRALRRRPVLPGHRGGGVPHPDEPARFPDNFPDEAFWWAADSTLTYPGGSALLSLGQEAAFANGPVAPGDQVAFGRIRIRATGLVPNAWYRFTYPFGQVDLQAVDKAPRVVNYTADAGCTAPPCDESVRAGWARASIGPDFLQWDTTQSAPPEGYVGNPAVPHRVTGSRFVPEGETEPANSFAIQRIDGRGGAVVQDVGRTDFFLLQGKLAGPPRGHFAAAPLHFPDARSARAPSARSRSATPARAGCASATSAIAGEDAADFWVAGGTCALPGHARSRVDVHRARSASGRPRRAGALRGSSSPRRPATTPRPRAPGHARPQ